MAKSIFGNKFTGLYSLSKTLRFELKPVGKTLENMREHLHYDQKLQTFFADQEIENAYRTLKPVFDAIHEQFITESLSLNEAKSADFSEYLNKYRNKKELSDKDFEPIERQLRKYFADAYTKTAEIWKGKSDDFFKEKGFNILTERGILEYINKHADEFSEIAYADKIRGALESFQGFFTYFGGFNQNRENYYETEKEAKTAVATRIVNENLPKFCDNLIFYEEHAEEYKGAYSTLKKAGKTLETKDGIPLVSIPKDIFKIEHFSNCFTQNQISEYNEKIGNANFLINLYNQVKNGELNFRRLPLFKTLYKQIGCGKKDALFFEISCDTENEAKEKSGGIHSVEEILKKATDAGKKYFKGKSDDGLINTVPEFLEYLKNRNDYFGVYWSKQAINTISGKYLANWYDLQEKLKKAKIFQKGDEDKGEVAKIPDVVELEGLFKVLDAESEWRNEDVFFKTSLTENSKEPVEQAKNKKRKETIFSAATPSKALLQLIFDDIREYADIFVQKSSEILQLIEYKESKSKEVIKGWMDDAKAVCQMLKYFSVRERKVKGTPLDSLIVETLNILLYSHDAEWFKWYDGLRNYLTKKWQEDVKDNKLKLNFENSKLASGWDVNKEPDNYCAILKNSKGMLFLAIIAKKEKQKGYNKLFENNPENTLYNTHGDSILQKMEYKLLPGPNKMLPKCLLPKSDRTKYGATEEILSIYDGGSFKKSEKNFSSYNLRKIIDFYKAAVKKYEGWRSFDFSFRPTSEYKDIGQFYSEVEKQGYKLDFVDINHKEIEKLVDEGKIYLFEIKNQDANGGKIKGHKNNLHTMYWQALFKDIENRPKLNGEAELFYRKALPEDKLEKGKDKKGKKIIKGQRFSKEKFLFHVPITLNFCQKNEKINSVINEELVPNKTVNFLGIDRGEKHLAYYFITDRNGKGLKQGTLNMPFLDKNGNRRIVKAEKRCIENGKEKIKEVECKDYNDLLDARAGDRDYARKNWQTIGKIKDLKDGYVSQVVRKIVDLAIENNAFIVLEDLSIGFKRGRQKIEKSVYQKLELALAKKLNFLVDKDAKPDEVGSITKALQLTPPVKNFGDIDKRKQVGIMLYTRANYTSQTDPVTGWRKTIYLKRGSEEHIRLQIVSAFTDIKFDGKDYTFSYIDQDTGKFWTLYSGKNGKSLDRFHREKASAKDSWISTPQNVSKMLDGLFIKFDKNVSLFEQIKKSSAELIKIDQNHTAWESLRFAIDLVQQIRNTGITTVDNDFILSPVRNEQDNHFDSRKAPETMPTSGDSNGAFNIARKGIVMVEHIKVGYKLYVADDEWSAWLVGTEVWQKYIKNNEQGMKWKNNKSDI